MIINALHDETIPLEGFNRGMDGHGCLGGLDALKTLSTMHACYFSIANDTADQRANLIEVWFNVMYTFSSTVLNTNQALAYGEG